MNYKRFALMVLGWSFVFYEIFLIFMLSCLSLSKLNRYFQTHHYFTADEILEIFQGSGYSISEEKPVFFDYDGTAVHGYYLKITTEDRRYGIYIQEMSSWESAKDIITNYTYTCRSPGCKGTCGYKMVFGNTAINVLPSDKYENGYWSVDYENFSNWTLGMKLHWILYKESIFD